MKSGASFSTILHVAIILLVVFGVPSLFTIDDAIDRPVPVTVYPVRDETVLPPPQAPEEEAKVEPEPEPEPEPEKEPIPPAPDVAPEDAHEAPPPPPEATPPKPEPAPRVAEVSEPAPPPPTIPEPSVVPPPPPPKPVNLAQSKPKPTPEPDIVPAEKPASPDPLASLLKSVIERTHKTNQTERKLTEARPAEPPPETMTMSRVSDEPLSSSVSDAIRRQVEDKWNVPAGAADAGDLAVQIRIFLLPDGVVQRAEIVDRTRLTQTFFRTMAESARRAVLQASPLRDLPPEKYELWREITFTFRPPV